MHFNTARRDAAVLDFSLRGAVGAIAAALMRSRTVRFLDDILFVKEPRTQESTEWHDDDGGGIATGTQRCSVWVSLADAPEVAGPVRFLRGSHRRFQGWRVQGLRAASLAQTHAEDIVSCPVRLGDVVVHHLDTIHAAGPNLSDAPRRSWALRFAGDDARFILRPTRHEAREFYNLADGEPLSGPRFPIAWPVEQGLLP
jgi:ectoine hydroxylase-related dioxygenase (phytanoyl-CoA dioxygenase family)